MELWSQRHRVDHERLLVGIVIEDNDLQEPTGKVGSDDQIAAITGDNTQRVANRVRHVVIPDAMLTRAARNLH